jgi:hypothetical protein
MSLAKYSVILFLLASLHQPAFGYTSTEQQIIDYRRILLSNDFQAKCGVLQHLQWAGLSDPRIFDWVEEYVLEFYQSSFLSRERFALKRQAIKALAYSGNEKYRYSLFLVEVEAAGKDIRHDGKLALAQLDQHIAWQQLLNQRILDQQRPGQKPVSKSEHAFANKNIIVSTYMKMLSIENPTIQQHAAAGIYHERIDDPELLALAFKQWQRLQSKHNLTHQQQHAAHWLKKAIDHNTDLHQHHYVQR